MTVVRERRHQRALRLSLPPSPPPNPPPISQSRRSSPLPSPDFPAEMEKLAVLGHGSGGTVYKVRHRRTNCVCALKVIRFDSGTPETRQQAAGEAEILKRVDSEFIVKCHGVFDSSSSVAGYDLCFLMEFMEGGSLHDVLLTREKLPEMAISGVARRVLGGLDYLHGLKIVHRDIKPSNLLINNRGEIKIADFGISRFVANKFEVAVDSMGTCAYMSPERFDPERWEGDLSDGFAGDVWSLGVVVLECHVGRFPLIGPGQKPDWATLMCAICFGEETEIPETMSPEFGNFVRRCLEKDWRQRGTVKELLNHSFVTQCSDSSRGFSGGTDKLVG